MNLKLYSIALLISAIPNLAFATDAISLTKEDFIAAERKSPDGETVIKVKLSKSGKAKLRKLKPNPIAEQVRTDIGGVRSEFKVSQPISGDGLEMGPCASDDANRVVNAINKK